MAEHRDHVAFQLHVLPAPTDPAQGRHPLAAGRLAEDLGFPAFSTGDHPNVIVDPWLHLGVLATLTSRIRLGVVTACTAYRPPLLTARLAADVDRLSDGRLLLGLGAGWLPSEFAAFGLTYPPARARLRAFEEALAIIRGAWGPEPFTYQGRYHSATDARVAPPPVQRPGPPLLIGGGGEQITLRLVAQYADACNVGPGGATGNARTPEEVRHKLAVLRGHCEAVGRPYETVLRTHWTTWLILAEDERRAQAKLERMGPTLRAWGTDPEQARQRAAEEWPGFILLATPERAVAYYQAFADVGMQYFVVEVMDATDEETIRLLAQEVAPKVRASGQPRPAA